MEDNLNECTTGILIDFEDQGNITVVEKSLMVLKNDVESNIDEFHLNLHEHTQDAEKEQSFGNCDKLLCITDRFNNIHLEAKMNTEKEMLSIPRGGWKTPSPKSMNIIWKEASKIIDQLHSSPIESTEVLLVDEDFPVPFPLHRRCLDEFSPESEKSPDLQISSESEKIPESEKNEDSTEDSISELHVSHINADIPPTLVLEPEITEPAVIQTEIFSPENIAVATKHSEPISIQMKTKNMYGNAFKIPMKSSKMNKENAPEGKSRIDSDIPPTIILEPEISESADIQTENSFPKNITAATKHSKSISIQIKSKNMYGNAFKTPIKSSKINKENASERETVVSLEMTVPKSDKNVFKKRILGDSNTNGIGMLKSESKIENSLKESHAAVIPEKMNSISNRAILHNLIGKRSSITMPRTSNAIQYQPGSRQKQALCKTSSAVETPSYPKFVRRTNSFQSENGKYSVTKRLLATCSELESMSAKDSIKKTASIKTESSIKPLKSRMSIGPIPNTGNGLSTPLRRSNSLSKNSGTFSSQISRPSIPLTSRKISSVAENGPQLSLLKRPVFSTSSRNRFCSRLDLPSSLPPKMNDNLPRKLFCDLKMPMKR